MLKYIALFTLMVGSVFAADSDRVELHKNNTLAFRDVVTASSVTTLQQQALKMSAELKKDEPIYLFLSTPGGSVEAGQDMISFLQSLPREVKTITSFAASMGFITVQNLGERLITSNGVLMSHRARGGVEGQIPGELNVRAKFWTDLLAAEDAKIAARVGKSLQDYQASIVNEYWVAGEGAVQAKMADRVVKVTCGKDMEGSTRQIYNTVFGPVAVTWSDCPLLSSPLEISFGGLNAGYENTKEIDQIKASILSVYNNRNEYLLNSQVKNTFDKYVK